MLSAIVAALSKRIEQNETLMEGLSEQLRIMSAGYTRMEVETKTADKERLLIFMQDWMENLKRFIEKVDGLQKSLNNTEREMLELRARVDRLSDLQQEDPSLSTTPVGVVTPEILTRLSPTEKQVLVLLVDGAKAAPEIGRLVGKSREHTARMMKELFEQGFVEREANRQPYQYRLNDKVRETLAGQSQAEATQPG
jgi:hypothetical protein